MTLYSVAPVKSIYKIRAVSINLFVEININRSHLYSFYSDFFFVTSTIGTF